METEFQPLRGAESPARDGIVYHPQPTPPKWEAALGRWGRRLDAHFVLYGYAPPQAGAHLCRTYAVARMDVRMARLLRRLEQLLGPGFAVVAYARPWRLRDHAPPA